LLRAEVLFFAATHNIKPHTPPKNIIKMWEVFQQLYKINVSFSISPAGFDTSGWAEF
jgi:hypothetical protein